jgi:hypothetical protein
MAVTPSIWADRRQFTRAQELGEHDGIAPVSLDYSVAGCPWNEAGGYHVAEVTGFHDLPVDPITAAARGADCTCR